MSPSARQVRVVSAAEAGTRDRAAIDAGIPSRALMQRAGAAAAAEIAARYGGRLAAGVHIFAGPGNNGGDAWVVAGALAAVGIPVRVTQAGDARSDDARAEREHAAPFGEQGGEAGGEGVVVDGLLGTGSSGAPRGEIAAAVARIAARRASGAAVVALDVPSGVDATTGADAEAVTADLTLTFGTMKRGLLVARGRAGRIVVLDIGLGSHAARDDGAPLLGDDAWVGARIPPIAADAHKGTRGRIVVVGGAAGMAGAVVHAARAAGRSGVGLVRLLVARESVPVVQSAAHHAMAYPWPESAAEIGSLVGEWAHAVLLGPGLGRGGRARSLVEGILSGFRGPVVLDADAINVFAGDAATLGRLLGGRPALLTPHAGELARLTSTEVGDVLAARFDVGADLARTLGATVLLKGVPTVVTGADGERIVAPFGTPALATGGSGDVLGGIAATLLAQSGDALAAGVGAAWAQGRASERAGAGRAARGVSLDEIVDALGGVWRPAPHPPRPPVLAELPPVGEE